MSKTACYDDCLDFALVLELAEFNNFVNAFLLCTFDKSAGIYNYCVRICRIVNNNKSSVLECVQKHLGINLIFAQPSDTMPTL